MNLKKYLSLSLLSFAMLLSCSEKKNKVDLASTQKANSAQKAVSKHVNIVKSYPKDGTSFTQGLFFINNDLYESSGQYGVSEFKKVDLESGKALKTIKVPKEYFAEGAAEHNGKIYQLTWESGVCFVYNAKTLEKTTEYRYTGEGWGLTNDKDKLF